MTKCTFLETSMRNEFRGSLILGALKNKNFLRLQKKLCLLPFLEFREIFLFFIFCNFGNFVIKLYIKICLVIIFILLFSSSNKLGKKLNKKSSLLEKF